MLRMSQETLSARTLEASAESCLLAASVESGLFAGLDTALIQPWYPTSKRHANPEVGP